MREEGCVGYGQASGLRHLLQQRALPVVTVVGARSGAGASLVAAGLVAGLGQLGRTLVLDERHGQCVLGDILGLRVRFDARSVIDGQLEGSRARVPVGHGVDYISMARLMSGHTSRAHGAAWRRLYALASRYDRVVVDGHAWDLAQRLAMGGKVVASTLVVVDEGTQRTDLEWALARVGEVSRVGFVVNRTLGASDDGRIGGMIEQMAQHHGYDASDMGSLPLAQRYVSDRQYDLGAAGSQALSLPVALQRLQARVLAWANGDGTLAGLGSVQDKAAVAASALAPFA